MWFDKPKDQSVQKALDQALAENRQLRAQIEKNMSATKHFCVR